MDLKWYFTQVKFESSGSRQDIGVHWRILNSNEHLFNKIVFLQIVYDDTLLTPSGYQKYQRTCILVYKYTGLSITDSIFQVISIEMRII